MNWTDLRYIVTQHQHNQAFYDLAVERDTILTPTSLKESSLVMENVKLIEWFNKPQLTAKTCLNEYRLLASSSHIDKSTLPRETLRCPIYKYENINEQQIKCNP